MESSLQDSGQNGSPTRDIVVIGASAGGVGTLKTLASQLPADFPAAVFIVLHVAPAGPGLLASILDRAGPLPALFPRNHMPIRRGTIYVAPSDRHLLVREGHVHVAFGPKENRSRPAIDPLFRSAAVAYGSRVIGVVLTGMLDDGAAGLRAVRRCGGLAVVQDPADAAYPDMPKSALEAVEADHVVPLRELGPLLGRLIREPAPASASCPDDVALEAEIAERAMSDSDREHELGKQAPLSCPECGGPVWEVETDPFSRYRCKVGHAFTARALDESTEEAAERALWVALRTLDDRCQLLRTLARNEQEHGREGTAATFVQKAAEVEEHARAIRTVLLREA